MNEIIYNDGDDKQIDLNTNFLVLYGTKEYPKIEKSLI